MVSVIRYSVGLKYVKTASWRCPFLKALRVLKLIGEFKADRCGQSVSGAGDINGDGVADWLIGAPGYPSGTGKGRGYVVFGKRGIDSSAIMLSGLNGHNGFKLDGEGINDHNGFSVSGLGDFNGDGHADLIIGSDGYSGNEGRSYVVLGGPGLAEAGCYLYRASMVRRALSWKESRRVI